MKRPPYFFIVLVFCLAAFGSKGASNVPPSYSSYLKGIFESMYGCASDRFGNVYIAYTTVFGSLKTTPGAFQPQMKGDGGNLYILKLNSDGQLIWATYFGGHGNDYLFRIATDPSGNLFLCGTTNSKDFPISPNAIQTKIQDTFFNATPFLSKLDSSGHLVFSTFFNTYDGLLLQDLCTDNNGAVYLTGQSNKGLPTTKGAIPFSDLADSGNYDQFDKFDRGFVAQFSAGGALEYCSYLGSQYTVGEGIAVDASGNIYISGRAYDPSFPKIVYPVVKNSYFSAKDPGFSFLIKIDPAYRLIYCDYYYLDNDAHRSLDIDDSGYVYLTGFADDLLQNMSYSLKLDSLPDPHKFQYAMKMDGTGAMKYNFTVNHRILYKNLFVIKSQAVAKSGNCYLLVENIPDSTANNPKYLNPTYLYGNSRMRILELDKTGKIKQNSLFGGTYCDYLALTAVEPGDGLWMAGQTTSPDFPITQNAFLPKRDSADEGFISHFNVCNFTNASFTVPTHHFNDSVCQTHSITLDAGIDSLNYVWSTGETTQSINVTDSGDYFVRVTNGCQGDTVHYHVKGLDCRSYAYFPNAFTPNGDTTNDVFKAVGQNIIESHIIIVNRWGEIIARIDGVGAGWDGTFHGSPCAIGVYGYSALLETADQKWLQKKGTVSLLK